MSSNSFAVSIGLSAIDGLLCAFVAVLVLALILIGPGISTGAPDLSEAHIVRFNIVKKDQSVPGIDLRLLIDISADGTQDATRPNVESRNSMLRLKGLDAHLQSGGDIMWRDCQVLLGNQCQAVLFVRKIKSGERWNVRLRLAEAETSFTSGGSSYQISAKIDSGAVKDGLVLTPSDQINICADWEKRTIEAHC